MEGSDDMEGQPFDQKSAMFWLCSDDMEAYGRF